MSEVYGEKPEPECLAGDRSSLIRAQISESDRSYNQGCRDELSDSETLGIKCQSWNRHG